MAMKKYGIDVEQMSAHGQAAARAAERVSSRTVIHREGAPIAVIVPIDDLERLESPDPGEQEDDPLLSLCGTCNDDVFVDSLADLSRTTLFRRRSTRPLGGPIANKTPPAPAVRKSPSRRPPPPSRRPRGGS
jgi:hypothetical protein